MSGATDALAYTHRLKVRPYETDRMGVVHHSRYAVYLEEARTEFLRSTGLPYKEVEKLGLFLVVAQMSMKFMKPVVAGDELDIECRLSGVSRVTMTHEYRIRRAGGAEVLCEAMTRLACVDSSGRPTALPEEIERHTGQARR